jgi:hypothetical protein
MPVDRGLCTYVYIDAYTHACVLRHTYMLTHILRHTYMHTHMHVY